MEKVRGLKWRVVALLYAWTIGIAILLLVLVVGTLYALVEIPYRLIAERRLSATVVLWIRELTGWLRRLHDYAFTGGTGFRLVPPLSVTFPTPWDADSA
jgi:apolipoprotein N-acyltransferase